MLTFCLSLSVCLSLALSIQAQRCYKDFLACSFLINNHAVYRTVPAIPGLSYFFWYFYINITLNTLKQVGRKKTPDTIGVN